MACRVESPTCRAICGRPPTVSTAVARSNVTVSTTQSLRRNVSPLAGAWNHIERTCGAPDRSPSTLYAAPGRTAPCDSSAPTVSSGAVIAPPFSSIAFAAMLNPSASRSPACTTYMNTWYLGPLLWACEYVAYRVESPISSAIRGRPPVVSTATPRSKVAFT